MKLTKRWVSGFLAGTTGAWWAAAGAGRCPRLPGRPALSLYAALRAANGNLKLSTSLCY